MKLLDDDGSELFPSAKSLRQKWYKETILGSPEWQSLTAENKRRNPVCVRCGEARSTESHHLTYAHVKGYRIGDLIAVCHSCHMAIHAEEEIKRLLAAKKK